jgi:ATP-dependent helicase/nuclease subunit A
VLERWPASRWGERAAPEEIAERLVAEGIARTSPDMPQLSSAIARWLDGPYLRAALAAGATLLREEPFVLEIAGQPALALRGAMDLVVRLPGGRVDVIDYKRTRPRPDLLPWAFQLRAYALAVARRFPEDRVRAGVLFLGAADEPVWLGGDGSDISSEDHRAFETDLVALAADYARARTTDTWDGVPIERCRALQCGFVTACHRRSKARG